jgi:hypothetical protein
MENQEENNIFTAEPQRPRRNGFLFDGKRPPNKKASNSKKRVSGCRIKSGTTN